ncbi:MAG: succinylglutamate desuccinylase/aspartoacylase family protein [Alphaproteobacteria bacterium]|nr:succinylglutamate desuccinylase/aspartoacylase family protein [Alphaproteobacteria bacterium]
MRLKTWTFAALAAAAAMLSPAGADPGDRIDGAPVIDRLDAASLARGQVHRFYFHAGDQNTGQAWYVPVMVMQGARPGPRLLLTAAIHGDELNGIAVIHRLFAEIDPKALKGTIVAVPGLNTPGLIAHNRNMPYSNDGGGGVNLNRIMPGNPDADDPALFYAGRLWSGLLAKAGDRAIDLHTQSRGTVYPLYAFADPTVPAARRLADLLQPDMIKLDPGLKGTLETALNETGTPAVTLELGAPKRFQPEMITRGVAGVKNVMRDMGMIDGAPKIDGPAPFVGNQAVSVRARRGGIANVMVAIGDEVKKGQPVATMSDPFGRLTDTYVAPVDGRVVSIGDDPLREPGGLLVRVLTMSSDPNCKNGC